jgi:quinol monooxygenase YgiN
MFMFYENWVAMADLDEHLKMPYLEPLLTRSDELLDGEIKIEFYTMLSDPPA